MDGEAISIQHIFEYPENFISVLSATLQWILLKDPQIFPIVLQRPLTKRRIANKHLQLCTMSISIK